MNMREFWANEAAMMRDKSGVLGKEVLRPVSSTSAPKSADEDFKTGYWLEGSKIVFSTFVYDNTKKGNEERKKKGTSKAVTDTYMFAAKNLQAGFKQKMIVDIAFKEKVKKELIVYYVSKRNVSNDSNEKGRLEVKINEISADLRETVKDKILPTKYSFDFRWKIVDDNKLDTYKRDNETDWPNYYYMVLNDGDDGEGGTQSDPNRFLKSARFSLGISTNMKKISRTILHESLHPLIDHVTAGDGNNHNPLHEPIFQQFINFVDNNYGNSLGSMVKKELAYETKTIRDNIMTTAQLESLYQRYVPFLDDFYDKWKLNDGTELNILQLKRILEFF